MNGTLALVGSGEYLPPMEPVDRLLLSRVRGEPRVVCLPTAAGTEGQTSIAHWSTLGVEHFTRLGARAEAVEVIDRASANDESLAARIRAANFVYLSGGKPDYLFKTLNGSAAWAAIISVLENGGVVAGCSAGVIIMPHFDEFGGSAFVGLLKAMMGKTTLLGIDGDTALVRNDGRYEVAGAGTVTVLKGRLKTRRTHGQVVEWL